MLFTKGNLKLPSTTYVMNITAAHDCPSAKLGLCEIQEGKCYALRAEKRYKNSLRFHRNQEKLWDLSTPECIAAHMLIESETSQKNKMKKFRFNEAGDFRNQDDVEKMAKLCLLLAVEGVKCYGYTARTDLDLTNLIDAAHVNVSNDLQGWIEKGANRFKAVDKAEGLTCKADCRKCSLCMSVRGKLIQVEMH